MPYHLLEKYLWPNKNILHYKIEIKTRYRSDFIKFALSGDIMLSGGEML